MEYSASAINVVFNPCVGPLPRIKISLFLLSNWADETHINFKNNGIFTPIKI